MSWSTAMTWWVACGVLVAAELASGTFYLLMLALGCVAGALLAYAGMGATAQIAGAAIVAMAATALWHLRRARQPRSAPVESNRDANLDVGREVQVPAWRSDGTARVSYRGAMWSARFAGHGAPAPGAHVIVALHGNELELAPAARS